MSYFKEQHENYTFLLKKNMTSGFLLDFAAMQLAKLTSVKARLLAHHHRTTLNAGIGTTTFAPFFCGFIKPITHAENDIF